MTTRSTGKACCFVLLLGIFCVSFIAFTGSIISYNIGSPSEATIWTLRVSLGGLEEKTIEPQVSNNTPRQKLEC